MKLRQYAWVVFNRDNCRDEVWEEYYKDIFEVNGKLKIFVFLGESPHAKGHCFIADIDTGLIKGLYHTNDFREAKGDEYSFSVILTDEE